MPAGCAACVSQSRLAERPGSAGGLPEKVAPMCRSIWSRIVKVHAFGPRHPHPNGWAIGATSMYVRRTAWTLSRCASRRGADVSDALGVACDWGDARPWWLRRCPHGRLWMAQANMWTRHIGHFITRMTARWTSFCSSKSRCGASTPCCLAIRSRPHGHRRSRHTPM